MWPTISRIFAALIGGYAFTWGIASFGITGLVASGIDFHDAEAAMYIAAFLVYLAVFLWAFCVPSLIRLWTILFGSAVIFIASSLLLQRFILS